MSVCVCVICIAILRFLVQGCGYAEWPRRAEQIRVKRNGVALNTYRKKKKIGVMWTGTHMGPRHYRLK